MIFGFLKILVIIVFLYLTWRKMHDDYKDDELLSYSWLTVLLMVVSARIGYGLLNWGIWNDTWIDWFLFWQKPGFSYLGAMIGIGITTLWFSRSKDWKLWAFMEGMVGNISLLMALFLIIDLIATKGEIKVAVYLLVAVTAYVVSLMTNNRYRSLAWYSSGKKGFVFFVVMIVVSLMLSLWFWWAGEGVIIVGSYSILGLLSLIGLFILGDTFSSLFDNLKRRSS